MAAHSGESTGRRPYVPLLILLLLTLLGYGLRAHNLDAFSFWTDEGLTPERSGYGVAQILRNDILIQGVVTKDTHPPLYYLIIHATRQLFGTSDFAFRYPSVLFGVLLIPLIYQLGRRMGTVTLGLIVALLATVNPLQVYYSQEARMYALLALLVTGMSYVLWSAIRRELSGSRRQTTDQITNYELRITNEERSELVTHHSLPVTSNRGPWSVVRGLLLYTLLAALALYTHYTVAFLIAAQALFWAWLLWRNGWRWVIIAAAAVAVLVAIPLIPYTLPRLMAGAEANYYYVSPLTMLADVIRFFNLGLTVDFQKPFIIALNVLSFGLLLLGFFAAGTTDDRPQTTDEGRPSSPLRRWVTRLFLLSWLLAVVFGLMAGSMLFKPMYQGVRHIMAGSPAFLLLVGFGIWALARYERRETRDEFRTRSTFVSRISYFVSRIAYRVFPLGLLLIGSILALVNLYANPAYVKDDFRAIVRFVETRAGNRDVIVYNNAVLLPLHEHYRRRPDIAVTALPAYPQFATGEEPELTALARDYDRVWFITDPPADKRDEDKLIQGWLDANLTEVVNRLFPARTTEARVIGYTTTDNRPQTTVRDDWEGLPDLTGVGFDSPLEAPTLWVDLYWQGERPAVNETLVFTLSGANEKEYFRHGHSLLPDEDARWNATVANRISYELPLPPGLPPGTYSLAVTPDGQSSLDLGVVEIASTDAWPVAPEALFEELPEAGKCLLPPGDGQQTTDHSQCGSRLSSAYCRLSVAVVPWDDTVLPGNNLPVTLYWRIGPDGVDLSDLRYRLEVIDARGDVLRSQEDKPGASWLGGVAGGALLREDTGLYIRPDTEPGDYRLRWTLLDGGTPVGEPVIHGRVTVEPWPLETEIPAAPYVIEADFGPAIRLHSYYRGMPTDGLLNLTLYWQALDRPETDYSVFIHLLDESGQIAGQVDSVPAGGARPTSGWRAGEVITDSHSLPIPAGRPPGTYRIVGGLYDPAAGTRPPVSVGGVAQPNNQVNLGTLQLPEDAQ